MGKCTVKVREVPPPPVSRGLLGPCMEKFCGRDFSCDALGIEWSIGVCNGGSDRELTKMSRGYCLTAVSLRHVDLVGG